MDTTFSTIKNEFLGIDALLKDLTRNEIEKAPESIYHTHLAGLNRLAATPVSEKVLGRLISDETLSPAIARISRLKRFIGLNMEIQAAQSVVADSDPWARIEQFPYFPNYVALARMEYGGAGLRPEDRVVFLGSGPLPLSLVCLSKGYGVQGVGIERDERMAALSRALIGKLGLDHGISVVHGNHFDLPLKGPCNLIMVGADASPKGAIFAHLATVLASGQMISYRIYEKGLRRLLDDQSMFQPPPEFVERARVRPTPPVNNTTVFAVKAG